MIQVAVGILFNIQGDVLIAKRPLNKYKPGLWEFPGGKIEANETVFQALQRELAEELSIQIISANPWLEIQHDYGDRKVLLNAWRVQEFVGEPHGAENQLIRWVMLRELKEYEFPEGNQLIIEKLLRISVKR